MAISPGTYDMTIQRRSDHSISIVLKDSGGSAVNITGYTVASQVWDKQRTVKAADATVTVTNASGGALTWKVTDTQTTGFAEDEYRYDLLLTDGSGNKEYWLQGAIYMSEGFTS